jgi:hypothetical protein
VVVGLYFSNDVKFAVTVLSGSAFSIFQCHQNKGFYGSTGSIWNRYGNVLAFEEINRLSREVLIKTKDIVQGLGYELVYADTDSVFIKRKAYSIILNKDPDSYQSYTPQHKIGKSLNKEPGSLIKYYKTGKQEDGYKGYSTNYQDLNIDIYQLELWKLLRDVLRLLDCDVQELEHQISPTIIEDYSCDVMLSGTHYSSTANKGNDINNNDKKLNNIQRNESLDKYRSLPQSLVMLAPQG